MTDRVSSATYRAMVSGRKPKASGRPLTPAARKVADATVETFRNDRAVSTPFRASGDVPVCVEVEVPVRIVSTPNAREHWSVIHRRAVQHDEAVTYSLIGRRDLAALVELGPPYVVTLTVKGPRLMDSDNCIAGCKAVRDSIARLLGVNDGEREAVTWVYAPQCIGSYSVRIEVRR